MVNYTAQNSIITITGNASGDNCSVAGKIRCKSAHKHVETEEKEWRKVSARHVTFTPCQGGRAGVLWAGCFSGRFAGVALEWKAVEAQA